ncbi:hypothetical protein KI688_004641 [Linnemannia hyalina]|uniref:Cyclin N-terminal domain-containing protein n=1 Tax=Linnemannia hyalina TaxID=64524 RepID=A0A9P8BPM0_9FUNG|nr:hypothetical protein KI688_004641 [Linnemannia hyalina]
MLKTPDASVASLLAFLNPTGRKTQSSNSGAAQDEARQAIPPLEEQHLIYTQQTNAATRRGGRGHMHDTLGDADTVDQFKHIFQNRPINNQIQNNNNKQTPTRNDTDNDHRHVTNTNTAYNAKYTQQKSQQQQQQPASSQQQNVCPTEYSERDQQLAKEQLRMVRRNLRNCSPNSSYFRQYAALVDDWRNFLPTAIVRDNNNVQHQLQQQSQQQRYQNDKDEFSEDSGGIYSAHDMYDGSEDEGDDEFGSRRHVVGSKPPPVKKDMYTRTMPSTSTSMPSFVKELLRGEELAMLASSAQFNSHHNLAAASDGQSTTWTGGEETEELLFRNGSTSSTLSSVMSSDDTEANDADADESYGPTGGRAGVTTRRNRVTKTNGPRTRYARHQQRSNNNNSKASSPAGNVDVVNSGRQQRQGRWHHELKKIGPADKSPAGRRRRSPKLTTNQRHHHQQNIQQQSAHFGRIHLEDIVRSIESEFTLSLDHDEGSDEESEDSLTYLVSGYENSGVEDDEEDLISSVHQLHQANTAATQRESSISGSVSAASSNAESTSPQSTLLNSSDALSEVSIEAPSPSSVLLASESTTTTFPLDQPPKYIYHKEYQPIIAATSTLVEAAAHSAAAAAVALAKTREAIKDQDEKATNNNNNNNNSARPSLKLETHTMTGIAPGALSAFVSRPLGSQYSLTKCNSTSSLYIDSTMLKSDVDETLRAVATVLYDKVLLSHKLNDCRTERIVNSSSYQSSERVLMSQADIFDFMRFIFDCGQNLGAENAIITLIYVERMTELGNLSFHAINWRRLLLGALILSIKVWEDLAVFNSDVCAIFEGLSVKDVNALERFSMAKLQYNVSVKRSVYAVYYFRLRDVSEQQYNSHYGKLTLSLSQRDFQGSQGMMAMAIPRNDSCASTSSRGGSSTNNRAGSNAGLMGMGMSASNGSSTLSSGNTSLASMTHHSKVPVGPGYRKWTLKPLSVREADRLEARSAVYCSNMMMEEQERTDAGCCLDKYSSASPEELHNLSATLLAAASMHAISSAAAAMATVAGSRQDMSASSSASSSVATMASSSASDLATTKRQQDSNGTTAAVPAEGVAEPVRRTLRLRKSRSDFFFQNTTPASIM